MENNYYKIIHITNIVHIVNILKIGGDIKYMETIIDETKVIEYLKLLNKQLKRDSIRKNIDEYLYKYGKDVLGYFRLRDEILPNLIGESESRIFFWIIFEGLANECDKIKENVDNDVLVYLEKVLFLHYLDWIRIKKQNVNPLVYDSINFLYSKDSEYNNIIFKRNDNETLLMMINSNDILRITIDLLKYYSIILKNDGSDKELEIFFNEIIRKLKCYRYKVS